MNSSKHRNDYAYGNVYQFTYNAKIIKHGYMGKFGKNTTLSEEAN
jgi:hypothetical protein